MDIRRVIGATCVGSVLLGAQSVAQAAEEGWHAGITFGSSNATLDEDVVAVTGATSSGLGRDKRDPGFKALLGYRFGRYFAMEGGYTHLGEFRLTRDVTAPTVGSVNADIRVKGLHVDAVGMLPIGRGFSGVARAGALLSETKTFRATSGSVAPVHSPGSSIKDEINLKYGLGLLYDVGKNATLRGEWDHYRNVGGSGTTGEVDIDLYSIGLHFRF